MTKTYTKETKDNEVEFKEEVKVSVSEPTEKVYDTSLKEIDERMAHLQMDVIKANDEFAMLQAERFKVDIEAGKVKLKK